MCAIYECNEPRGLQRRIVRREAYMQTRLMAIGPEETHRSTRKGEIMSATRYRIMLVELDEDCADTGAQLEAVLE